MADKQLNSLLMSQHREPSSTRYPWSPDIGIASSNGLNFQSRNEH